MYKATKLILLATTLGFSLSALAETYKVSQKINSDQKTEILDISEVDNSKAQVLRKLPYYIVEGPRIDSKAIDTKAIYIEEIKTNLSKTERAFLKQKLATESSFDFESQSEVRDLVTDGPAANRIHLTILGDGYTLQEKDKFFADAERITKNLFATDTFSSYLPLFQVHAVFTPSKVSGIGDGEAINTAFGLYRMPKGSKRAIYPGNERALEAALRLVVRTDYPIVIANDDYYGGLGGRYAISTRSERSGMVVLNHELGHNFGEVGEEYDGGQVYSGANSTTDPKGSDWAHWINDKKTYNAKFLSGNYVWQNLRGKPYRTSFKTSANETLGLELSTVGWSSPDDVYVYVNGKKLDLGDSYHNDRNFYVLDNLETLLGNNSLEIKENIADGDNVIATAFLYAYPQGFNFNKGVTAAFATYSDYGTKNYRPTHDGCLMRNMKLNHFCSVDQENMWHKFLARVSLIDGITKTSDKVSVQTPNISGLTVRWYTADNSELTALRDQTEASIQEFKGAKNIKVSVELQTPEVRKYDSKFKVTKTIQL